MRILFFLLAIALNIALLQAQQKIIDTATASIHVLVTNMKDVPRKGESVILKSQSGKHTYSGTTNAQGLLFSRVKAGETYSILIKAIGDTVENARVEIPVLYEGETFAGAMKVQIQYELPQTFTLKHVTFDFAKSTIRASSLPQLNALTEFLKQQETTQIEIAGHTDNIGSEESNLKLSEDRANTIRNWLLAKGISSSRIIAKGYGATQPISDNDSEIGRKENRRTEVRIIK